ncbi:MAG TPA: TolC family protein [Bdellovibrionota bacterium]|nr:TolC family protein [Bdellovibrionota bacterium]
MLRVFASREWVVFLFFGCNLVFNAEASAQTANTAANVFELNIHDAVKLTVQNNVQIKVAQARYEQEAAKSSGIWATVLPDISFHYDWDRRKDSVAVSGAGAFLGDPYNSYRAGFSFTQPILRGGALWNGPIQQDSIAERARLDRDIEEREQLFEMASSYYTLLLYQEQLNTLRRQYDSQSKLIRQARQRYRMGAERELPVLQFETQAALLKPRIIEAESHLQTGVVQLLNIIGKSDVSSIRVNGNLESARNYRAITASEVRMDARPELKRVYESVRGVEAAKAVQMAEHWPTVSAVGNWGNASYTRSELFSPNTREWSYGLRIEVPLFSGLDSFSKRRELAAQTAEVRYQEKAVRDAVAIDLVQSEKTLRTSQELIEAKKIAFDLAKRSYQKASEMFRFGTLTYRDFFAIERDLIDAELSYYASLNSHLEHAMRFHVATGQDLRALLESIESPK